MLCYSAKSTVLARALKVGNIARDETVMQPAVNVITTTAYLMKDMCEVVKLVSDCYKKQEGTSFTQRIIMQHHDDLPQYSIIYKRELCVPVTAVECERTSS
jgi:hypothetical protein